MHSPKAQTIVYCIHTQRLVVRCWNPADAPMLLQTIAANVEHLRAWMPWAWREPESLSAKIRRLQRFRANFDLHRDFVYGIFTPNEDRVLGGIGSHRRIGAGAAEIGYWIDKAHAGQGLITEATAALTRLGFELEQLRRIEIHCDPQNLASAAVPRKLGFTNSLTIANCVQQPSLGPRDTSFWVMSAKDFSVSPAARAEMQAFDAAGEIIPLVRLLAH